MSFPGKFDTKNQNFQFKLKSGAKFEYAEFNGDVHFLFLTGDNCFGQLWSQNLILFKGKFDT